MRRFNGLLAVAFLAALAGCESGNAPALGEPIALDMPDGDIAGPRLGTRLDGGLVLSWMTPDGEGASLHYALLDEHGVGDPQLVTTDPRMFVNWADLPSVMQLRDGHWVAHWLSYSADQAYSYDVLVAQSFDGGASWSGPVPAHTDGTPTEHGFVSMHREPGGVGLVWLDGRATPDAPMTLRGAVITPAGRRTHEQVIDNSVCDCCQTDIAVSSHGPIAVYRDRTAEEIRDIYVSRRVDGTWEPGSRLYADDWQIAGCPVNGPSIVADGDQVAIAWFSAAGNVPVVRVMVSDNGGTTFGPPVEISRGRLAGYVGLAIIDRRTLAVSWVSRTPSGNALQLRTVAMDGSMGPVQQIADIGQVRVFPQLGYRDGYLFLFWTDLEDAASALHGVRVPVTGL